MQEIPKANEQAIQNQPANMEKPEKRLQENAELFQSLVDHMLDGMIICNWEGKILFANRAAARIVGLKGPKEGIGMDVLVFVHPDSKNCLRQDLALVKGNKGGFLKEYRLVTLDGKNIWIEAIGNKVNYNGCSADLVTFRDITNRKRAEAAAQETAKKYRAIFETTGTAMVIIEEDMTISLVNRETERLSGYSREEIEGKKKYPELIQKDDLEMMVEYHKLRRIDPNKAPGSYEARLVDKDGNIRNIWITVDMIPATKQSVGSLMDVTDQKRIEKALRESENKYRTLIENSNEAIFIVQDGHIIFPNPRTLQALGYTEKELSEVPFAALIHPEDRDSVVERYLRRLKGEDLLGPHTYRAITKSGEEVWIRLNSVTLTWDGRPATLNLATDVTQEKRFEKQFQAAQKMEAVGTLAGGLAHNFNNLLTGIQGYISLALFDMKPSDPHYADLKAAERQVKSGANLTSQLLGFARKGKYEVKPADLNSTVHQSADMFERTQKVIRIHRGFQRDLWTAEVDKGQIEQALLNLYINAWQAMPGGGDLYLGTENVTLDLSYRKPFQVKPGKYVKISVRDTGTGIDKAIQQKIFEPFFTTKATGQGNGLGLASVYGIVKNHGGHITVYSELGRGAIFNMYLPASDKEVVLEKKCTGGIQRGTETILLIDDEEIIVDVVEKALKLTGYKVFVAKNGEEGLEVFQKNQGQISLVVLDMIMPGMSGGKVFGQLKKINRDVKVILSSGYSLDGEATEIMAQGCSAFIQKPFGILDLSQKIREVMGGNNSGTLNAI
jgi:two-component system, cell cycle sensor histidine kinase and response regulator CckA